MPTYQVIYKCRLCGEEIINSEVEEKIALGLTVAVNTPNDNFHNTSDLFRYEMHNCKDGSYGFVDFLGFRKKKEPEE